MMMLDSIVVCLFLTVPRSCILVASLADEPLQAAFTSFDVLLGPLLQTSMRASTICLLTSERGALETGFFVAVIAMHRASVVSPGRGTA